MIEGERVEVSTEVAASADKVWDVVADVTIPTQFSSELTEAEWIDSPGLGARFRGYNENGDDRWSTTCTVIEWEPERRFSYVVEDVDDPVATWGFAITPNGTGSTLSMHAEIGPGESYPRTAAAADPEHAAEIIHRRLQVFERNMTATIEGMARIAESR